MIFLNKNIKVYKESTKKTSKEFLKKFNSSCFVETEKINAWEIISEI